MLTIFVNLLLKYIHAFIISELTLYITFSVSLEKIHTPRTLLHDGRRVWTNPKSGFKLDCLDSILVQKFSDLFQNSSTDSIDTYDCVFSVTEEVHAYISNCIYRLVENYQVNSENYTFEVYWHTFCNQLPCCNRRCPYIYLKLHR